MMSRNAVPIPATFCDASTWRNRSYDKMFPVTMLTTVPCPAAAVSSDPATARSHQPARVRNAMMFRMLLILTLTAAIVGIGAADALAQQDGQWPSMVLKANWRGPGFYLSWIKIISCWLVFVFWVRSTDWISQDGQEVPLNYLRWNSIAFGSFLAAFVLVWLIPYFWLGFPLLVIAYVAPFVTYVLYRNSKVMLHQRVFTPDHIRFWLSVHLAPLGIKIQAEPMDPHEKGPPVKLTGRGGTEVENNARLLAARQIPALLHVREVLADAMSRRAAAIIVDYGQEAAARRFLIDGVWHEGDPLERETGDPMLEAVKILCGLNPQDRQGKQTGTFRAEYESIKYDGTLTSQGTKTGERALIELVDPKIRFDTLDDIGMRAKMQEQLKELLYLERGFLLFSAMPGMGLRSTADVFIRHTDRLTREFMAIEEESHRYGAIENCPVTTYNAAKGETPATILPKVIRSMPDVIVIRDLVNGDTVRILCDEIEEKRLILSTVRARDSAEALVQVLALGVTPAKFADGVSAVFNQRLVRKLCDDCKEAYTPSAQVLQQLGIPEGRIQSFHRPRQPNPEERVEVCKTCGGIGYKGRTAIFELLVVTDGLRKVLAKGPDVDAIRRASRKEGLHSLQEEGILLVAKGVTSLPELMRVLKQQ